ncbi:MAG TPA: hypothetical protein VHU84_11695, partial [Lacipirellulaceae bacterium]|nr:hypothetical protein [Lacipirellulaceae bacterium]
RAQQKTTPSQYAAAILWQRGRNNVTCTPLPFDDGGFERHACLRWMWLLFDGMHMPRHLSSAVLHVPSYFAAHLALLQATSVATVADFQKFWF